MKAYHLLILLLLCLLSSQMVRAGAHQGELITCYLATTKPTIDGKWTAPNEWNDTSEVELTAYEGSGTAYLRVKYDQEYLYALVDFVSDSTMERSFALMMIDGDHDGGAAPDVYGGPEPDDYGFVQGYNAAGVYSKYVFLNPLSSSKFLMKASTNAVNDPYSTSPHLIYEFRVLRSVLGSSVTIGFYARAVDLEGGVDVAWPSAPKTSLAMSTENVEAPDDWGDLEFSATPIPEFPPGPSLFFFTILVAAAVLFKKRSTKIRRPGEQNERSSSPLESLKKVIAGGLMIASFLGAASLPLVQAHAGEPIKVLYLKNPPNIDGVCKIEEWKDATKVKLQPFSSIDDQKFLDTAEAYMMIKYDDNNLYGCIDLVSQNKIRSDMSVHLYFDTMHNGLPWYPLQEDDIHIGGVIKTTPSQIFNVKKFSWATPLYFEDVVIKGSLSPSPNVSVSEKNLQYEFLIPMKLIRLYPNPNDPKTVGFNMWASSSNFKNGVAYPYDMGIDPNKYKYENVFTDMVFMPQTVTTTTTITTPTTKTTSTTTTSTKKTTTSTTTQTTQKSTTNPVMFPGLEWLLFFTLIGAGGIFAAKKYHDRKK